MRGEDTMKYPKINTLWKRDENDKFNIIEGNFSCPEFEAINKWDITEKIDGTNIKILYNGSEPIFGGRNENSQVPTFLLEYLQKTFNKDKLASVFPEAKNGILLYGEGYGNKIQDSGKQYRKENCSFALFDALIDGWWLERDNVKDVAQKLGIEIVPSIGIMTTQEAIDLVRAKNNKSQISEDKELVAEGIVARSHPLMLFRDGKPIMWKLKVRDYIQLEKR